MDGNKLQNFHIFHCETQQWICNHRRQSRHILNCLYATAKYACFICIRQQPGLLHRPTYHWQPFIQDNQSEFVSKKNTHPRRLEIDDIILILQQTRLQWYGHVLRKEDNEWVKKCMEYEVEGSRPRGRPKRTWREVVQKDCKARNLNRKDAMYRGRWKKLIKIGWWSGWWVGDCFFWYRLTRVVADKKP